MRTSSEEVVDHRLLFEEGLLFVLVIPHTGILFERGFYLKAGLIFEDLR